MKSYNVKCPICGTVNHNLYLEETHGWMECEKCKTTLQVMKCAEEKELQQHTLIKYRLICCSAPNGRLFT